MYTLEPIKTGWNRTFAWRPILTENAGWCWFCLVDRKYVVDCDDDDNFYYRWRKPIKLGRS